MLESSIGKIESSNERAKVIKLAFQSTWNSYRTHAYPNDELMPLSNSFQNVRNTWGETAFASLTTAIIMDQPEAVDDILYHIRTVDFTKSNFSVSLFRTTIGFLGSMISGYDLLTGPYQHLINPSPTEISNIAAASAALSATAEMLLNRAKELADFLSWGFNTTTGIPHGSLVHHLHWAKYPTNDMTSTGTLLLEWTRLSDLTGDPKYANLAQRAHTAVLDPKLPPFPSPGSVFPGLSGRYVDIESGQPLDSRGGYCSGVGSFYEYLLKSYVYDPIRFKHCRDRWIQAADSTIRHLASHPSSRPDLTFLAQYNGTQLEYWADHTSCFAAGMFIYGGAVLNEEKYIAFGLKLVESLREVYRATKTGVGPNVFAWLPSADAFCDENNDSLKESADPLSSSSSSSSSSQNQPCTPSTLPPDYADQTTFYQRSGYYITDPIGRLRPEVLESIYYAYRVTRDPKYRDWAWEIFLALNASARDPAVGDGTFAEMKDVNGVEEDEEDGDWKMIVGKRDLVGGRGLRNDKQYSYLFSETLKYAYIIHLEDEIWQVNTNYNPKAKNTKPPTSPNTNNANNKKVDPNNIPINSPAGGSSSSSSGNDGGSSNSHSNEKRWDGKWTHGANEFVFNTEAHPMRVAEFGQKKTGEV